MTQPPQGGPQPQHPYPQPPGQYPQYPQGPQYPPQYGAPFPGKRGPSKGLAVLKLLVGLCASFGFGVGLIVAAHDGIAVGALIGAFFGVSLYLVFTGGAGLAGKKLPMLPALSIIVVGAIIGLAGGPPVSAAYWKAHEEAKYNELLSYNTDYPSKWQWDYEYFDKIPADFQRPDARGQQKYAEVLYDIKSSNLVNVRQHVYDIQINHKGDPYYTQALDAAAGELKKRYDETLEKLGKPGVAGTDAEFAVDDQLRAAFKDVLADLARAPEADIYVAFTNSAKLEEPEGSDDGVKYWLENSDSVKSSFPDGKVKIIDPGRAFSTQYDEARRASFMEAASRAFRDVFDAHLLTLKPLEAGASREGKIILEVSSTIVRVPNYFNNYETSPEGVETSKGLLFGIVVDWELKLFDRKGGKLYDAPTQSKPASNISIGPGAMPDWGVYSILMDSAYFNYSREVVGRFGLVPPAEQTEFSYRDYGISGG